MQGRTRWAAVVAAALVVGGCASGGSHAAPGGGARPVRLGSASTTSSTLVTTTTTTVTATSEPAPPGGPTLEGDAGAPAAPLPPVVIPPSAFLGLGMPQPGSYFRSLLDDHSLDGQGKFVALTFDDGPGPYTRQIVDVLNVFGVKATFFQIADQAGGHPELVRYMVQSGMHIGSHSRSHAHLIPLPEPAKREQVVGAADAEDALAGPGTVKCYRPPYGQFDQATLDLVAARGLATAMWSVDTDDWKKPGMPTITVRALTAVKDRSIILMHDGGGDRSETVAALPWIITALRNRGFSFVTVC